MSCSKANLFLSPTYMRQLPLSAHRRVPEGHAGTVAASAAGGTKGERPIFTHLKSFKVFLTASCYSLI